MLYMLQLVYTGSSASRLKSTSVCRFTNSTNNGEMEFGLLDDGEDCEHNGVGFTKISKIVAMQDDFPLELNLLNELVCSD